MAALCERVTLSPNHSKMRGPVDSTENEDIMAKKAKKAKKAKAAKKKKK
jgi:hypothetical protein